ncbi:(2,3-dihydroxybenzoyl)adenylate synthase [Micromonospora sp. CPCC 206061]|uniref:(2,3-dihydroxybenzoyl)adenylate synthase n=1 Tax=Micromonospora sp. CPCC 206061 TaxID=3122410 RepID=UPI002FF3FF8C
MLDGCTPWPAEMAERYRARGYWRGATLGDLPQQWSRQFGERTALVHGKTRISYAELDRRIDRMAAGFRIYGIDAGDRVVVQLPNMPEFVITVFALLRANAKPVFCLLSHRANEIRHLLELTDAAGYVVPGTYQGFDHAAMASDLMTEFPGLRRVFVLDGRVPPGMPQDRDDAFIPLAEVRPPIEETVAGERYERPGAESDVDSAADPSDVAFFLLSGGTTALPKLIPRTHDDYDYQTRAAAELIGLTPDDVYLAVLPVEFNFTWGCPGVVGTLRSGGTVTLVEDPLPDDCFETIERERVTVTSVVPTVAQLWLEAADNPYDLSSLRLIQVGGAPLHREIAERIGPAFDCRLQQVFGMAEGLLTFTRETDPKETVLSTQGRPLSPDDEIRVVDEAGVDVQAGETGELLARGPYTLRGYYRAAEHNTHAFTPDGFYRTGDLVRLTATDDIVVAGRVKDVIIKGGNKVSASEVEGHLLAHPAVERVAVVPMPDPLLGERICAYVRPEGEPPTLAVLREALQGRGVADYKLPDRLEIVADLPLTGLGKIDKKALAADAATKAAGS